MVDACVPESQRESVDKKLENIEGPLWLQAMGLFTSALWNTFALGIGFVVHTKLGTRLTEVAAKAIPARRDVLSLFYPAAPIITMGMVGDDEPVAGSTVIANAFASTSAGKGGWITTALPRALGLNTPAGMGAPCAGISQSS